MVEPYCETSVCSICAVERPAATSRSISWRTASAVDSSDCATETSVHEGQRTTRSMAAAR